MEVLTLLPEAEYPLIWESEAKRPNVPQGRAGLGLSGDVCKVDTAHQHTVKHPATGPFPGHRHGATQQQGIKCLRPSGSSISHCLCLSGRQSISRELVTQTT